jgi:hypothetical protein
MCSEHIEGDEWGTYVALVRAAPPERGMPYRARASRARSHRRSRGWGEPIARRRVAGRRQMNGGRVRDAHEPEPKCLASTGELIDIERVTISSEGDRWKSTCKGNSLAVYPTSRPVLRRGGESNLASLSRRICRWLQLIHKDRLAPLYNAPFSTPGARKRYRVAQRFR